MRIMLSYPMIRTFEPLVSGAFEFVRICQFTPSIRVRPGALDEYKCDYGADYGSGQLCFDAPAQQGAYHRYQAACRQTECRYHGSEQFYDNEYGRNDEPQEPT